MNVPFASIRISRVLFPIVSEISFSVKERSCDHSVSVNVMEPNPAPFSTVTPDERLTWLPIRFDADPARLPRFAKLSVLMPKLYFRYLSQRYSLVTQWTQPPRIDNFRHGTGRTFIATADKIDSTSSSSFTSNVGK